MILNLKKCKKLLLYGNPQCNFKRIINDVRKSLILYWEDEPKESDFEIEARRRAYEMANARRAHLDRFGMPRMGDMIIMDKHKPNKKITKDNIRKQTSSGTVIIVAGDSGLGINSFEYYDKAFSKLNEVLEYNNTYLIFVRGNHDDPSLFNGEVINYSNIKAIPDYSIVETMQYNILCIGGGISVDRSWSIEHGKRIGKQTYWKNEATACDEKSIHDYIATGNKISMVVSHVGPSFTTETDKGTISKWVENDSELMSDIFKENEAIDMSYVLLNSLNSTPIYWAYSHNSLTGDMRKIGGIIFRDMHFPGFICPKDDIDCMMPSKGNNISSKLKSIRASIDRDVFRDEHGNGIEMAYEPVAIDEPYAEAINNGQQIQEAVNEF